MYGIDNNRKLFSESKHRIEMMFETVYASLLAGEFLKKDQVSILVSRGEYKSFGMETTVFIINNTDETIEKINGSLVSQNSETGQFLISVAFDYADDVKSIPPRTAYGIVVSFEKVLDYHDGTVFTMFELDTSYDVKYEIVE